MFAPQLSVHRSLSTVVLVVLLAWLPLSNAAADPTPQPGLSQTHKRLHEILQDIDQELRDRLECHAINHAQGLPPMTDPKVESESFLGRLRSLQASLEIGEGHPDDLQTVKDLQNAVRSVMHQARNLAHVADWPADLSAPSATSPVLSPDVTGAAWLGGTGVPSNDSCQAALPITAGTYVGDTTFATPDGTTTCGFSDSSPDVWLRFTFPTDGWIHANTFGSDFDTVLSVHSGCPGTVINSLSCNDNGTGLQSSLAFHADAGVEYLIRVAGFATSAGRYTLNIGPQGGIAGTVTDAVTGAPIPFAEVAVTGGQYTLTSHDTANVAGEYLVEGLAAGSYHVHTNDAGTYQAGLYDGLPCPGGDCDLDAGTAVEVSVGTITNGIDFALQPGGAIAGTMTVADTGEPINRATVIVMDLDGNVVGRDRTNAAGEYRVNGLASGSYVAFTDFTIYRDEIYADIPCPGGPGFGCTINQGTPIAVSAPGVISGIDFALEILSSISGTVQDRATGQPLWSVPVLVFDSDGSQLQTAYTDSSGHYQFGGLPVGTYFLRSRTYNGYQDQIYDGLLCFPGACDVTLGTPVVVSLDTNTSGIDFALDEFGRISGTVNYDIGGQPIRSVRVWALNADGYTIRTATTDLGGDYEINRLPPALYNVHTNTTDLIDKLYDDLPWEPGITDPTTGAPISVELATLTSDIDFSLLRGGTIAGTVTDGEGPVRFVNVEVSDSTGRVLANDTTDDDGSYVARGLPSGTYYVTMLALRHLDERYPDVACEDSACPLDSGTPISLTLGEAVENIDAQLQASANITGTVTAAATGRPLRINMILVAADGTEVDNDYTDRHGEFQFVDLPPGTYFARSDAGSSYTDEIYDGLPCPDTTCDPTVGTPIVATAETTTSGIDFALEPAPGGMITGLVTHAYAGTGLRGAIYIWNQDGAWISIASADNAGRFVSDRIPAGTYFATARVYRFEQQLYDGRPCLGGAPEGCDPLAGTPILVTDGGLASGVDFALTPEGATCDASDTALCLSQGRFRVGITWQDPLGNTGDGQAQGMTNDTGYFWFFDDDNVEIVVKVLDACGGAFDRFWVFAGGLTNVQTTLTVTDTLTEEVRTYTNPQGAAFEPILDTDAFATCDIAPREPAPRLLDRSEPSAGHPPAKNLGLDGGRFVVEAFWSTAESAPTAASAELMTNDTGYFWFFDEDNVEIVVKVLDACDLAPFHNYWVYAAGLTNVEVTLVVTDTLTGQQQFYFNPLGSPFQPVQHTGAFSTCQ